MNKVKKIEPRKMMEKAIEVMRKSIPERRSDGKSPPKVGAVIIKPDGKVETAYRGELRDGDHAEFTLLERKNRSTPLEGSVLFATLEPCAPGARSGTKLSCAERIVLARIKEVWIGIEDPDPTVDRKGIKYLQDNEIKVYMFDRDLQETIHEENKQFLLQAEKRAEVKTPQAYLSMIEKQTLSAVPGDLSTEALETYQTKAGLSFRVDSPDFNLHLFNLGLLKAEGANLSPSVYGILLFGQRPRDFIPHAGLLATIRYADGQEELRDFDGPLINVPIEVERWLKDKLPNVTDRSQMQSNQVSVLPFELIREAVVNALVHRDYDISGAKCQLIVEPDVISILSPGSPVEPVTLEQLQNFTAPMLSRNPVIHYIFAKMKFAEERGLGLKSFKNVAQHSLPLPKYSMIDPYLRLDLYRHPASSFATLPPQKAISLSKAERAGWAWLTTQETVSSSDYESQMNIPNRTALNHLKHFVELGLVERVGSGPSTRYKITRRD